MTFNQIIQHYGSIRATAEATGVRFQAVHAWKKKGVPAGRQWQIQALTAGRLTVDPQLLERTTA